MSERNLSEQGAQFSLGHLIGLEARRDAIHIAVAPMVAAELLQPGQWISHQADGTRAVAGGALGIVDPFLPRAVQPGERFWMFLRPNTITGLRHQWTHPEFGPEPDRSPTEASDDPEAASRRWIEAYAASIDKTYRQLMRAAEQWLDEGVYTYDNSEAYKDGRYYAEIEEFWHHYGIVTGHAVSDTMSTFYTCAC